MMHEEITKCAKGMRVQILLAKNTLNVQQLIQFQMFDSDNLSKIVVAISLSFKLSCSYPYILAAPWYSPP